MNPPSLVSCVEDAARGGPQTLVVIGDHPLHAAQAAVGRGSQELCPECLGLGGTGGDPQHLALAVLVHGNGDYRFADLRFTARLTIRPPSRTFR
jgi:hypothetical protein